MTLHWTGRVRVSWLIPRSTLGLTLAGFLLAALPLCISTVTAIVRIDRMAAASQSAAVRASNVNQHSRQIAEALNSMEAALDDYLDRRDDVFYTDYIVRHTEVRQAASSLAALDLGAPFERDVQAFLAAEQALFDERRELSVPAVEQRWRDLGRRVRALIDGSRELVEAEGLAAAEEAVVFERLLLVQAVAVLPLTVLLAVLFARLISRPIRQIDSAIRGLAADSLQGAVEIQGPRDLQEVGACLDVLRKRIAELETDKLNFLRRISHELKTPLTTIRQGAELLADPAGTPPDQAAEIGELLKESSLELQRLIEDLLEYGKTRRLIRDELSLRTVDLRALLQRLVNDHALALRSKRIKLRTDLAELAVPGDVKRLRTALGNVIGNAVKYTPPDGEVAILLAARDGAAIIDVVDSGPGIVAEERSRVFEPFYQGQAATGGHVKGTGLGLAIAKDYVESHGGRIDIIDSTRGTHLRIRLPAAAEA